MIFTVVGMRFYGGHIFSINDSIIIKKDPSNKYDNNAIKVLVKSKNDRDSVYKHVAYVARDYTQLLAENLDIPIRFISNYRASTTLAFDID